MGSFMFRPRITDTTFKTHNVCIQTLEWRVFVVWFHLLYSYVMFHYRVMRYEAAVPESPVVIVRHPLHQVEGGPRQTAYGPVPVVSDPHVQVPRVEVLKVLIHRHKLLESSGKHTGYRFAFRAFSRWFYPKGLTICTFVRGERNNNISASAARMFIEPSVEH